MQAQADLKQAQADYQKLVDGASPEDIAQAQAQLAQAQGQYSQTTGSVTGADVAAARAKLEQAKAQLGPAPGWAEVGNIAQHRGSFAAGTNEREHPARQPFASENQRAAWA